MGNFKDLFITESLKKGEYKNHGDAYSYNDHQYLKSTIRPALKHKKTGTLHIGKRGDTHQDLGNKHNLNMHQHDSGYYHGPTKTYHSRKHLRFDSTDLMTHHQLTRFYNHGSKE